ncbi:T-lymphocyte activation antigen CD80-like [Pseudophryne corroboree]|uniref:T-lymphocyte activation antigen CD80-like n=1 Tax=Pseudophryne corroboree TaxID=495146 RepID=UPI0030817989
MVFAFFNGQEQPDHQELSYQKRTHLFKDNLTLSLSHVSRWDEGQYDCHIFLLNDHEYELEDSGQVLLSIWAEFSQPQITVRSGEMGTENTARCSSQGGYPKGYIHWKSSPHVADSRNETWTEQHPQTQLYNISGGLALNTTSGVSVSCCVVAGERRVCSKSIRMSPHERSRAGRQRWAEGMTALLCLTILLSLGT